MLLGIPVAFVIGITVLIYMLLTGTSLVLIPQRMFVGIDSFVLMAVPFFILAGGIMNAGGLTKRLIRFAYVLVGTVRGGLAYINIIVSMIFAGITGAATADVASIGAILIPAMKKEGYDVGFSAAITAASSTIGGIIPPSIPFIVYAITAGNVSVAALFLGGVIPGLMIGLFQILAIRLFFMKKCPPIAKHERISLSDVPKEARDAILALIMPLIMVGGILTGLFTPTEASAIACVYALIVTSFVYKELTISELQKVILNSAVITGACFLIIAVSASLGWVLTAEMVPLKLSIWIFSLTNNTYLVLILVILFLLFIGTFMDTLAALIITVPILLPTLVKLGLNPVHAGIMVCFALYIGLITPPVGICLYIASSISGLSIEKISKAIFPFIILSVLVLLIVAYFPDITLFVPRLFGKIR
jgi:C4-dicarboxylate transporter DctM subunit